MLIESNFKDQNLGLTVVFLLHNLIVLTVPTVLLSVECKTTLDVKLGRKNNNLSSKEDDFRNQNRCKTWRTTEDDFRLDVNLKEIFTFFQR